MGTSTSSTGPGSGIPFDPPWLDVNPDEISEILPGKSDAKEEQGDNDKSTLNNNSEIITQPFPSKLAPKGRFSPARRNITLFCQTDAREYLKKALKHYTGRGMGGSYQATKRMIYTANSAANLYSVLNSALPRNDIQENWYHVLISKRPNPDEFINEVLEHLSLDSGTLEDESSYNSIADAISEFLTDNGSMPDRLTEEDIQQIMGLFIANEIYNRVMLDIGLKFEKYEPEVAVRKCEQLRGFIHSTVDVCMHEYWDSKTHPSSKEIKSLIYKIIHSTFEIFESEEDE